MSNLGAQCWHSELFGYLIRFWSYQAHDYTITKPRIWPTCWSSSDKNQLSSHGDIHPAIQTFISLVTMEPASLLACYSAIAADHDYTLLEGQPLSQLPDTSWHPIPSCSPSPLCSRSAHPPPQSPVSVMTVPDLFLGLVNTPILVQPLPSS